MHSVRFRARHGQGSALAAKGVKLITAVAMAFSFLVSPVQTSSAYAAGATYYVSKSGNDTSGTGTATNPWATLQKAANTVGSGDTVRVAAGTYDERVTIPATKSGTATARTRFVADGKVVVSRGIVVASNYTDLTGFEITGSTALGGDQTGQLHVTGDYNVLDKFYIHDTNSGSAIVVYSGASNNTVTNFTIDTVTGYGVFFHRGYKAALTSGATGNTARGGTIAHHKGNAGIMLDGDRNTADGVTISGGPSGQASPALDGDGFRVNGTNMTIRNSVVHNLWEWYNSTQHTDCLQFYTADVDGLVVENSIFGTWQFGGHANAQGPTQIMMTGTEVAGVRAAPVNITIKNSLFMGQPIAAQDGTRVAINYNANSLQRITYNLYNNTFWGVRPITSTHGAKTVNAYNNYFGASISLANASSSNLYNGDYNFHAVTPTGSGFTEGPNSLYASRVGAAQFVNTDKSALTEYGLKANLRPVAGSPLINKGKTTAADAKVPSYDLTNAVRDGSPDIGAYEFGAGTTTPPADTTIPNVTLTSPTNGATVSGSVALAATAADNAGVARVEFRVDGALIGSDTTAPYTGTWSAVPGSHVIQARAIDAAGNLANSSATVNVAQADAAAPTTTATVDRTASASGWYLTAPIVTLTANEAGTTSYAWDAATGPWSVYAAPITAPQGARTLYYRSTDTAGNTEITKSLAFKVDSQGPSAPVVTSTSHPDATAPRAASTAQFGFTSTDSASGVSGYSYTFDRAATTVADTVSEGTATSASFPVTADGAWYLHVRARDAAGNWGTTTHRAVLVDRTGPTAPVLSATAGTSAITLAWTKAADALGTVVLRSTAGYATSPTDPTAQVIYDGLATTVSDTLAAEATTYYYTAFSRDALGNLSAAGTATATIAPQSVMSIALDASTSTTSYNKIITLRGKHAVNGVLKPSSSPVTVKVRQADGSWVTVGAATYNASTGTYEYRTRVKTSTTYRMRCEGDTVHPVTESNVFTVSMANRWALTLMNSLRS